MTYTELADFLGIGLESAKRRAFRAKWRRQPGNDERARVAVPLVVSPAGKAGKAPKPTDNRDGVGDDISPLTARFLAQAEATQAELVKRTGELAEAREALARREGELAGLREALRRTDEALALAREPWWHRLLGQIGQGRAGR